MGPTKTLTLATRLRNARSNVGVLTAVVKAIQLQELQSFVPGCPTHAPQLEQRTPWSFTCLG